MSFASEKATLLEYEVFNQLESDSQIIVLTERKIEALMICRMLSKHTNSNIKLYVEHQSTETNYTGLGASYLSKNQMEQDIENFKRKIAPKKLNLDWNVEPYIALAKLVVNEQIMIDDNERINIDVLTDFQQVKTRLLVSNCYKNTFFAQSKISVILFNEEKFKPVALSPPVLLNGVKISSVRDQKEETLRKIRKIEKNMKQIYEIKNKNEFRNAQMQGNTLSEFYQLFNYEKKNNTIPRVQWYNAIDLFQSVILCNFSNNYQNISFSLKFIGNKDNYQIYKVNIILDVNKAEDTIYCADSCLISSIIPYILNLLKTMSFNKTPIVQGFSIIETPYCTNRRKAESIISKAEEQKKDDTYGGQQMPTIDYEYLMDPVDTHFRKSSGSISVRKEIIKYSEEYKLDCQQWGVICDTKLFHGRRIKTTLPTWEYFEDMQNNKEVEKDVRIYRSSLSNVLLTDHYKFFNIFMIYEIYKARNLFYYQFLCRSINSAMEIINLEKAEQPNKDSSKHNFELISKYSNFLDLVREFVNSDSVLEQIGTFLSEDSIEQEGSLPLLVPIKMLNKSITIDEEVVNKFIISIMHTMKVYLELETFEKGTFIYDSTKFYNLFAHDFYSGSSSTYSSIMNTTSDSLYRSESMSVNDSSTNVTTPDTLDQISKNLNENKISGNGSDSILKDDSKSMNSVDSKSSKSLTKKKELAEIETKATEDNSISELDFFKRSESSLNTSKSTKTANKSSTCNTKDDKKKEKDNKEKKRCKDGKDDKQKSHKDDEKNSKKSKKETKDSKDKKENKEKNYKKDKKDKKEKKEDEEEVKIAKQHSDKEERKWDLDELAKSFRNAYPLWTKITEKCRFKDFVIRNFEEDLKIKSHSRDNKSDVHKVYYYTVADCEPVYIRNKSEVELNMKNTYKDDRDRCNILFDLLVENIQEAFTSDKAKRTYDNSFLEFLGEGVITIFLAWHLIINFPMFKDADSLRIENSSSKRLFEIMTNENYRLHEFTGIPVHKTLEFFVPPVIRSSYYLAAKFFDRNPAFYTKLETVKCNEIKIEKEEQKETFEEYQDDEDGQEIPYMADQDFLLFVSMFNKKYNKIDDEKYKYSYSNSKKKEISKYFKGVHTDYLKSNDIAVMFRALLGAIFNCCGTIGASRVMKRFNLINDECICAHEGNTQARDRLESMKAYTKILDRFSSLGFPEVIDIEQSLLLIRDAMGYEFKNPNILIVAFTHKSKGKHKNGSIWDDYNLMEFLGNSVIKFFNCKRIIKNRDKLLENKEKNFTEIQRLKFIRVASEKNLLFSFICIKSGIYKYIRHDTKNEDTIYKYKEYIDSLDSDDVDFDKL